MNALIFPGQGSQEVGMGKELYENLPNAADILNCACEILGYDIKDLLFNGPAEKLTNTKYAQPAIYTVSAMYLEQVKALGIDYEYVAGHSLGEYSALLAAGVFDFETGLQLVSERGNAMSKMNGKGTMAAVMGLGEEELSKYLPKTVVMANLNSKTQIVISGPERDVLSVGEKLEHIEGLKFSRLHVSAAFHSPQMAEAHETMKDIIQDKQFSNPSCFVISNTTGLPTKDSDEIKSNLIDQITGQVRWYDTIISIKNAGVSSIYEVGHGDVLKKLNKTITFRPKCLGIEI